MTLRRYRLAALAVALFAAPPALAQMQEWSQTVEGAASSYDGHYGHGTPASLAVDDAGNVYVATMMGRPVGEGSAALLVKYGPDGTPLWMKTHDGPAGIQSGAHDYFFDLALGDEQGVYVVGSETYEAPGGVLFAQLLIQKYDRTSGDLLWTRTYNSFDEDETDFRQPEEATEVATDAEGNVYVAGTVHQQGTTFTSNDGILIKYTPDGNRQWVQVYASDEAGANRDQVVDLALDDAGNAFLIGTVDAGFDANYFVHEYAPDGSPGWFQFYDSPGTNTVDDDVPVAVALDAQGNVVVTGQSPTDDTDDDYLTIKYTPEGTPLWTARFDNGHGSLRNDDLPAALTVDASGNVYVTGRSQQADASYYDYLTVKYGSDGNVLWTRRYNGPVNEHDTPYALALDAAGNVYVSGNTGTSGGTSDSDYGTIIYSPDGDALAFVMKEPDTLGSHDYPTANAVDADGNLYVTGFEQLFSSYNLITVKYGPLGTASEPVPEAAGFALRGSHPNPFAEAATIRFSLPEATRVRLAVYDLLGREVAVLVDGPRPAGEQAVALDGRGLAGGVYVVRLEAGGATAARRVTLVR